MGRRARKKSRTACVFKLQLEGFFSWAAKRVATMSMRAQYTGSAWGRTESDCARLVNAAGNIVKIHSTAHCASPNYHMCTCPKKIFVNPAMQISLSDANPLFAFRKSSLSLWRSFVCGDRSHLFFRFVFPELCIRRMCYSRAALDGRS